MITDANDTGIVDIPVTPTPTPSHATVSITLNINNTSTPIEITSLDAAIDPSMTKPGVWAFYDEHNNLLDVHQTVNIAAEWKRFSNFTCRSSFTTMRNDGIDLSKTTCKVIAFESNLKTRLLIEQAFATKYNAKYWSPQPGTFQCDVNTNTNKDEIETIDDISSPVPAPVPTTTTIPATTSATTEASTSIPVPTLAQPITPTPVPSHASVFIAIDNSPVEITSLDAVVDDSMTKPGVFGLYDENNVLLNVYNATNIAIKWKKLKKLIDPSFTPMRNDGIDLTKTTYKVIAFEDNYITRGRIRHAFVIQYNVKYCHSQGANNVFTCAVCNVKYVFLDLKNLGRYVKRGIFVCPTCKDNVIPGEGNVVNRCEDCHCYYKSGSSSLRCPSCSRIHNTISCSCCGKEFILDYLDQRYDTFLCPDCKAQASGSGSYYKLCIDCHKPFRCSNSRTLRCDPCYDIFSTLICPCCSCEFKGTKKQLEYKDSDYVILCSNCKKRLSKQYPDKEFFVRCKSCGEITKTSSQFEICPLCNKPTHPKINVCEQCGKEFESTHQIGLLPNQHSICPSCREHNKKSKAVLEYEDLISQGWLVSDNHQYIYKPQLSEEDIRQERQQRQCGDTNCQRCGRLFHKCTHNQVCCHFCYSISKCPQCDYWFVLHDPRIRLCSTGCSAAANYPTKGIMNAIASVTALFTSQANTPDFDINTIIANAESITTSNYTDFYTPGVWCKINTSTGEIIDLMATTNISREFKQVQNKLANPQTDKYKAIVALGVNIEFKVLVYCGNYQEALEYEFQLAQELHPQFWSPGPQQLQQQKVA